MDKKIIRQILQEKTNRQGFPTQQEVADFLAKYYPEETPEDKLFHDNWGLFSKNPSGIIKRILLCTTPTSAIIKLAKEQQYDLVISHHDFLFNHPEVPQIIYHSAMDEAEKGHNQYFINKMGLKDLKQYHKVLVGGDLYKPLTLEEFKQHIIRRGFEINGMVWESPNADNQIESVLYCSGLGGMLLYPNHIIDARKYPADVYVTGELVSDPSTIAGNPFKYIIELGHTSSEKPLFKWVKNMIRNRWSNVEVDLADNEMDIWGDDNYKNKMEKRSQSDKEWEEKRDQQYHNNRSHIDIENDWEFGNLGAIPDEEHPLIIYLIDNGYDDEMVYDIADFLEFYYEYDMDKESKRNELYDLLNQYEAGLGQYISDNVEQFLPDYDTFS